MIDRGDDRCGTEFLLVVLLYMILNSNFHIPKFYSSDRLENHYTMIHLCGSLLLFLPNLTVTGSKLKINTKFNPKLTTGFSEEFFY